MRGKRNTSAMLNHSFFLPSFFYKLVNMYTQVHSLNFFGLKSKCNATQDKLHQKCTHNETHSAMYKHFNERENTYAPICGLVTSNSLLREKLCIRKNIKCIAAAMSRDFSVPQTPQTPHTKQQQPHQQKQARRTD